MLWQAREVRLLRLVPSDAGGKVGQKLGRAPLPMTKDGGDLAADDELIGQSAQGTKRELVVDAVFNYGTRRTGREGGSDEMTLPPGTEWTVELDVTEALVPAKVLDTSQPTQADGREGYRTEGKSEACAVSGDHGGVDLAGFEERRGPKREVVDPDLLPGWHQARQICWIGEEGKDQFNRIRDPLFGAEVERHVTLSLDAESENRTKY